MAKDSLHTPLGPTVHIRTGTIVTAKSGLLFTAGQTGTRTSEGNRGSENCKRTLLRPIVR